MSFIAAALIGGGAALVGGMMASDAAGEAAGTQAGAARESAAVQKQISDQQIALQREQFEYQKALQREQFEYQKGLQAPYQQAGANALARMQGGAFAQPAAFKFGAADYTADPGYAFRLSEGQKALDRQAAARGGLISGSALKAAQRYGQEMGSQEFQNAYNRALTGYNTEVARADTGYNRLAAMAGVGQTSTDKIGAAGQFMTSGLGAAGQAMTSGISGSLGSYGTAASEAIGAAGQARASGYVGQANALTGALTSGANQYMNYSLMNKLFPSGGGAGTNLSQLDYARISGY